MEPILDTLLNRDDSLRVRFFPVRHYSPTSARMLRQVAMDLKPAAILIEGPHDYNERIEELYLEHELPVALFSYVRYSDNTRASAFYPFCEFSPEWQAIQTAKELGIPVRFIDKPWYTIAHDSERRHRYADRKYVGNDYISTLCERLEVQDFDEVWDVLFELDREMTPERYLDRAYHFVYQLRYMGGEATYEDQQREEFMAERIQEALDEFPDQMVMVVTGGFHTPALNARLRGFSLEDLYLPYPEDDIEDAVIEGEEGEDAEGEEAPQIDPAMLAAMAQQEERVVTDHGITMTPFTYERIDKMSGYQSGVHGPAFYRYVWEARQRGELLDGRDLLYQIVLKLRDKGQILSTSDAIAVETTAWALANMRGRQELWRYDLLDALSAAVIKEEQAGEYNHPVLDMARQVFCGDRRGLLGDGTDLPPLVKNTRRDLHRAKLTPDHKKITVKLELLKDEDREKSVLLHRCRGLGLAGFKLTDHTDLVSRDDLSNPTETWEIIWSPEYEASLIENAIYGADLPEAATAKLLEQAREIDRDAERASMIVLEATLMGLDESTEELYERLFEIVREDGDFFHLTKALDHLIYLYAFDEVFGGKDTKSVQSILAESYKRSLWLFEILGTVPDRDKELIDAIGTLFYTFQRCANEEFTDRDDFVSLFSRIGGDEEQMPLVRGATLGALFTLSEADMDQVLDTINYFTDPMDLGDFLIGFFSLAREAAQRDSRLLDRLNELVMDLNEEQFWEVLPGLRLAFTFFTPREKHNLIDMLFPQAGGEEGDDALAGFPPVDLMTFEHAQILAQRVLETIDRFGLRHPRQEPQIDSQAADDFAQPQQPPTGQPQGSPDQQGGQDGEPGEGGDQQGDGQQGQSQSQGQQQGQGGEGSGSGASQDASGNFDPSGHGDPSLDAAPNQAGRTSQGVTAGPGAQSGQSQAGAGQQAGGGQQQAGGAGSLDGDGGQGGSMQAGAGGAGGAGAGVNTPSASGSGGVSGRGEAAGEDFEAAPTDAPGGQGQQGAGGSQPGAGGAGGQGQQGAGAMPGFSPEDRMRRWKMVLGVGGEDLPVDMPESWQQREQLVSFLYDREYGHGRNIRGAGGGQSGRSGNSSGDRSGGSGESALNVPDWINGIHQLFPQRVIERLEKDALDRYNIEELVTRPEMLEKAEPNITLMKAVLRTKHLMDEDVLKLARNLVKKVVAELIEKLAREVRTPFTGSLDRRRRSFLKVAKNFSPEETIRRNLKHYDPDHKKIIIQDPYFFSRIKRQVDRWQLIIVVDQSGSMLDSVIHSAVTASIFWGIRAIKTHLVVFDTEIVDLTADCQDPVDTLMKVQLGGGTDIGKALRYAESLIENPRRTIVLLITDFYEGGPINELFAVTRHICEAGTKLLGLAALDGTANPCYDQNTAQKMVNLGAEVGAMTPGELAAWVAEKVR